MDQALLRVTSNRQLEDFEHSRRQQLEEARAAQAEPFIIGLSAYIRKCFDAARWDRISLDDRMLKSLRQRMGQYDPGMIAELEKQGGNQVYMLLTQTKCRGAEAWMRDVLLSTGMIPWDMNPTPLPELSQDETQNIMDQIREQVEEIVSTQGIQPTRADLEEVRDLSMRKIRMLRSDEAKQACDGMKKKISDQLHQGNFMNAIDAFLSDLCTYQFAVIKGPIVTTRPLLKWVRDPQTGQHMPDVEEVLQPWFECVSPFDFYWEPGITNIQNGYTIEQHELSRRDVVRMKGQPGYSEAAVNLVLEDYEKGMLNEWLDSRYNELERRQLESRRGSVQANLSPAPVFKALEFNGSVSGKMLAEWGREDIDDMEKEYEVNAWLIGHHVVRAVMNTDPLHEKPYRVSTFNPVPNSIPGLSLPELISDAQAVCNAAARAIVNNMAISCLTGDTVVYREGQHRSMAAITLDELWEQKNKHNSGLRRTKLRSLNEETGEFFGNRVVDIVDNGVAEVFKVVTEKGYTIRATGTHRFMRDDGEWQHLDDFDSGEFIAVNGQVSHLLLCIECGGEKSDRGLRCRKCASQIHNSRWNQQQAQSAQNNRDANATTARARWACQVNKKDFCEACGIYKPEDRRLHVHHRDRDPWNNVPDNLMTVCEPCHHELHAKEDSFGDPYLHRYVSYDRIISIESVGEERVFDLCMTGPNHNFIANGFVSHNSGPQCELNIDRMPPGEEVTEIFPWKIWQVQNDPLGTTAPAVRFDQPTDNSASLMQIFEKFARQADEHSGIPAYSYGDTDIQGAGRTASGLSMLMGSAGKGIRQIITGIDSKVIRPALRHVYRWNMRFDEDESIKGDADVIMKGTSSLVKEELNLRRNEFLQITANEIDSQVVGIKGRAHILREVAKSLELDVDKIVPPEEELDLIDKFKRQMETAQQQAELQAKQQQPQQDQVSVQQGADGSKKTTVKSAGMVSTSPGQQGAQQGQQGAVPVNGQQPAGATKGFAQGGVVGQPVPGVQVDVEGMTNAAAIDSNKMIEGKVDILGDRMTKMFEQLQTRLEKTESLAKEQSKQWPAKGGESDVQKIMKTLDKMQKDMKEVKKLKTVKVIRGTDGKIAGLKGN